MLEWDQSGESDRFCQSSTGDHERRFDLLLDGLLGKMEELEGGEELKLDCINPKKEMLTPASNQERAVTHSLTSIIGKRIRSVKAARIDVAAKMIVADRSVQGKHMQVVFSSPSQWSQDHLAHMKQECPDDQSNGFNRLLHDSDLLQGHSETGSE
ncbi:hypothetical protein BTVI_96998 [Pitangus sulphuratus]|nr:hypothetical protein BTVI_96998 [Pitangus sulphuratus]